MPKILEKDERINNALEILKDFHKSAVHYEKTEFKYENLNISLSSINNLAS